MGIDKPDVHGIHHDIPKSESYYQETIVVVAMVEKDYCLKLITPQRC
jgi:hypothetical protein